MQLHVLTSQEGRAHDRRVSRRTWLSPLSGRSHCSKCFFLKQIVALLLWRWLLLPPVLSDPSLFQCRTCSQLPDPWQHQGVPAAPASSPQGYRCVLYWQGSGYDGRTVQQWFSAGVLCWWCSCCAWRGCREKPQTSCSAAAGELLTVGNPNIHSMTSR